MQINTTSAYNKMINLFSKLGNEALLQILKQSPNATAVYTEPGLIIKLANDKMLSLWGKDEQVIGMPLIEALPELKEQPFIELLEEVWTSGKPFEAEGMSATLEIAGVMTTSYFDFTYQPIKDGTGNVFCILNTATDVTERVKAGMLIREKEIAEKRMLEDLEALNEEYKTANEEIAALNEEYQATNEELSEVNQTLIQTFDKLAYTENRLQELIKTTPIGLTMLRGKEMIVETANPEMLSIWKTREKQIIGKPLLEIFPVLRYQDFAANFDLVFSSSEKISLKELSNVTMDDEQNLMQAYWDVDFHPLLAHDGTVNAVMATVQDVTERVMTRNMIAEDKVKIEEANEELLSLLEKNRQSNNQLDHTNQLVSDLNERLKIKNEQLINSNNEFQRVNEELNTVNKGLEDRNRELKVLNSTILDLNIKLSDSEEIFRNLVIQAPVAILLLKGDNFTITMANAPMLELLGKDSSIIGKPLFEEIPELKGQEAADKLIETYTKGIINADQGSLVMLQRDGELQSGYFNFNYAPYTESGKVSGVIDMAVEVTDQVQAIKQREAIILEKTALEETLRSSEERLQSILDTMAEGVTITDQNGKLTYANARAEEILRVNLSEITTRTYYDHKWRNVRIDGSPLPDDEHPMQIMMTTGKPVYDYEIGLLDEQDNAMYLSINAAPVFGQDGKFVAGIGTFMDVTTRRMIAQGKDDFISIASHELKTPITSLKASLQMLERANDKLTAEMRAKLVNQAIRSLDGLSRLTNDLLDSTRIDQGQLQLHKKNFTIRELFDDCCSYLTQSSGRNLVFEGDTDTMVEADDQQIGQVIVNFINNAIKYAPGSEDIIISAQKVCNTELKITVKDFGPGIDEDKIEHLFKRYYRTNYEGQKFTGLGLGLYISSQIIENHGGRIGANSELGKGSEFWFILPLHIR